MGVISHYLLTRLVKFSLGDEGVDTVEEALSQVQDLLDHYQLSSAEVILEIRADRVSLRDRTNQDLETFSLSSLLRCDCVYSPSLRHPSLLLLVCQSSTQKRPSVYLFSCATAERIRDDIKRVVSLHIRENRFLESGMDISGVPSPPYSQAPNPPSNHPPPPYPGIRANGMVNGQPDKSFLKAQVEVDLLNHCFDDIEAFMGKLQQSAEAQMILYHRSKKNNKRSQKKSADEDLLTAKAKLPSEKEFIDTFQKFKYSFSLLARVKSSISNPTSDELVHHVFKPLDMIVRATGGPGLAASVSSPAMTQAAVTLIQNNLTTQEQELWTSLGPNWTQHRSALRSPVAPYTPTFLDGWRPPGSDVAGWVDPVEAQHRQDAELSKVELTSSHPSDRQTPVYTTEQNESTEKERLYRCSYDFVARNSSELSVLQGETLEVIESSKRWWKCRNKFNEVGFVPFNILEPVTHVDNPVTHRTPKPPAAPPTSNTLPNPSAVTSDPSSPRPRSMVLGPQHLPEDTEKVMQVNDELLQRLTSGKNLSPRLVIPRSTDTTAQLDYSSPPEEVENWLRKKGFSQPTVQCLGVLNGAQLFSLNKEELRAVIPEEGARVYSQLTVQRALLEDARRSTELETVMERQKMKVDLKLESGTL